MAENDQNDEYKFDEYESYDHESMGNAESGSSPSPKPPGNSPKGPNKDVRRNALIAVGVIIAAMVGYKVVGGIFSGKSTTQNKGGNLPPAPVAVVAPQQQIQPMPQLQPQPVHQEVTPQPIQQPTLPVAHEDAALKQQVESIATNQQNVQSQVSSMNEQVGNVNNNINNLSTQINQLNQTITDLTNQLNKQSEVIAILMERTKPKVVRRMLPPQRYGQANIYYINAVIPGRAWLIGTNGSTLTVREGTKIAGYGVVKLIDSMEGRVLTSSGRIIKFSQDDS
ncbi:MAG: type IVB secretion system protein IcmG/DotF [Legionella sp.]|uniref:type IVB secretion system protein IcmG/DotF n=1 Tax=Legionella sp. TaxID=459 RepID=UPI0028400819|nr:type IVB secretion system protein IcmG/DotF [Legionella sp.]